MQMSWAAGDGRWLEHTRTRGTLQQGDINIAHVVRHPELSSFRNPSNLNLWICDGCIQSGETVELVQSCPQSQQAWEEAAERKSCGSIVNLCVSLVYHCVMNTWRNLTVEVCAPSRNIVGGSCAEYSFIGHIIQRNSKVDCMECPIVYNSTESYRYPECYQHVRPSDPLTEPEVTTSVETTTIRNVAPTSSVTKGGSTTENQHSSGEIKIIIPICMAGGMLLIIFIILIALCRYKKRIDKNRNNDRCRPMIIGHLSDKEEELETSY
uniref:Uncharacterized protein LOC111105870 n=1 Tax=Crassostrea virginica TaxID=6565 RepID=A0A8B8AZ45_CRAVI|nr:uncharacterized protein LOC111105870 [Crassostrea virginica]